MKFNEIPKFIVNLDRRPDRLEEITKEMKYLGWDFQRFPAIDTNSYIGITKSTFEIIKIAKEQKYPRVMIIEDDCGFMPYAKDLLQKIEDSYPNLEFAMFNLAPTQNREISVSKEYDLLLDMTNLPEPSEGENARGIYAANMVIYDQSIYDDIFDIGLTAFTSGDYFHALDDYTFKFIVQKHQSYCPILPIAPQKLGYSNISEGMYSNWYMQTYNWNRWCPTKIPSEFMDQYKVQEMKNNGEHKEFYYVS
jgi:hypothetical protein